MESGLARRRYYRFTLINGYRTAPSRGRWTVLRIHFTADDLARVTIALEPRIAWELSGSVQLLQSPVGPLAFEGWRRRVRQWMTDRGRRTAVNLLTDLYPHFKYFPDFVTPPGGGSSVDAMLDAILSTGGARRMAELSQLAALRPTPSWLRRFAEQDRQVESIVGKVIHAYRQDVLGPIWPTLSEALQRHRAALTRALLTSGVEGALKALGPSIRWNPPVLEAHYPLDRDFYLGGRGLEIIPSFFCWGSPVTMADPGLPPSLAIPIERLPGEITADSPGDGRTAAIAKLLGRTRAQILESSADGATSTELSENTAVSPASISHHTAVLRDSGLLRSRRDGRHIIHEATQLGRELLLRP